MGGNIFKKEFVTTRISRELVILTVKFLESITSLALQNNMLGSTGVKETSGDIDLAVDYRTTTKDRLERKLNAWSQKNDPTALVQKSGINVHFRCPIAGRAELGYVQVDFMFITDVEFTKWSMRTAQNSKYPGRVRTIILASIAKALNLRYGMTSGLASRETNHPLPKGNNPDAIAKILLNQNATAKDLESPETILHALKNDPAVNKKLSDARETFTKEGSQYKI